MQSRTFTYLTARAEENAMMLREGRRREEKYGILRAATGSGMHPQGTSRIIIA